MIDTLLRLEECLLGTIEIKKIMLIWIVRIGLICCLVIMDIQKNSVDGIVLQVDKIVNSDQR